MGPCQLVTHSSQHAFGKLLPDKLQPHSQQRTNTNSAKQHQRTWKRSLAKRSLSFSLWTASARST